MIKRYLYRVFVYLLLISGQTMFAKVVHVIEDRSVLDKKQQLVVKFAATWCTTCQHIAEPFEAVSDEAEFQHITFVHVDIERHEQIGKQHGVIGVPTFAYFDNGSKKGQVVGANDVNSFKDYLRASIRTHFNMSVVPAQVLAALPREEPLNQPDEHNDTTHHVLAWVWQSITGFVDDVATVIKGIFA